jgi:hypothetical protein
MSCLVEWAHRNSADGREKGSEGVNSNQEGRPGAERQEEEALKVPPSMHTTCGWYIGGY